MRYGSAMRRLFKIRWNLHKGVVQDHHVIPINFRYHPVVVSHNLDLNASPNIVMMPTYYGMEKMNLRSDRLVHYGNHERYNDFVKFNLDFIKSNDELLYFQSFLRRNCRDNIDNIPWT